MIDHWPRLERDQRSMAAAEPASADVDDPWDDWLDTEAAYTALGRLPVTRRDGRRALELAVWGIKPFWLETRACNHRQRPRPWSGRCGTERCARAAA